MDTTFNIFCVEFQYVVHFYSLQGHTMGAAMTGGSGGETLSAYQEPVYQQTQQHPCQIEFRQFIECTQTQNDISMCQGFNEVLKECKLRFG